MDIDNKLDQIINKQTDMNETLIRNTISLEEHVRRTEILEESHSLTNRKVDVNTAYRNRTMGGLKLISGISTLVGIIYMIIRIVG